MTKIPSSMSRSGMPKRRNFASIVPTSPCSDSLQIKMSRWFHVLFQAGGEGPRKYLVSTTRTQNVCHQLCIKHQNHKTRACNPRCSFVFHPHSRALKFVLHSSALVIEWSERLSGGPKATWHGGVIPHPPGNIRVTRIIGNCRTAMDRQNSNKGCGSRRSSLTDFVLCSGFSCFPDVTYLPHTFLVYVSEPWLRGDTALRITFLFINQSPRSLPRRCCQLDWPLQCNLLLKNFENFPTYLGFI